MFLIVLSIVLIHCVQNVGCIVTATIATRYGMCLLDCGLHKVQLQLQQDMASADLGYSVACIDAATIAARYGMC